MIQSPKTDVHPTLDGSDEGILSRNDKRLGADDERLSAPPSFLIQLLVYKLDRLGREARLTLDAVAELKSSDVRIKSITEEFDAATASGRLTLTLRTP